MDIIKARKKLSEVMHESKQRAKQERCCICGKETSSFCNSHSIPQFILRRIALNGEVLNGACALDLEVVNQQDGINRSGTFSFICKDCDNDMFSDYEDENALLGDLTTRMLAQIDLKNVLHHLKNKKLFNQCSKRFQNFYSFI